MAFEIPNDGDLVFDATTGEGGLSPAETVLPYIEQRADPDTIYRDAGVGTAPGHVDFTLGSPEENDGSSQGIIINWTPGDSPKGETVGVIAIITPPDHDAGVEWTYCAPGQPSADGSSQGIIIDWRISGPGDELTTGFCTTGQTNEDGHVDSGDGGIIVNWTPGGSGHDVFPTETVHPYEESVHTLYDLVL